MAYADALSARAVDQILDSALLKRKVAEHCVPAIVAAAQALAEVFRGGGKVLLCGNGGSAADCQHMAAELVFRLRRDVDRPGLSAIALTTDTSLLTAYANDEGYEGVFARQVQALGRPGDALIGISTSGRSANVVLAARNARAMGMKVVALCGPSGPLADLADVAIAVPGGDTQRIQESHLMVEHVICDLIDQILFAS